MAVFQRKDFRMHSGGLAHWKIEFDEYSEEDVETFAWLIAEKAKQMMGEDRTGIREVYGIPSGGSLLEQKFIPYLDKWGTLRLIVDDVLTTGASMEEAKIQKGWSDAIGIVIYARGEYPSWVKPIFAMPWFATGDDWKK